jgi:hypothetical protein
VILAARRRGNELARKAAFLSKLVFGRSYALLANADIHGQDFDELVIGNCTRKVFAVSRLASAVS